MISRLSAPRLSVMVLTSVLSLCLVAQSRGPVRASTLYQQSETPEDASVFIKQAVPTHMLAGNKYDVEIVMKNIGQSFWTANSNYRLGSQNPEDNVMWGLSRADLPTELVVAPGEMVTFTFRITAPSSPGNYNFQWQMLRSKNQWFGSLSPNTVVNVTGENLPAPSNASSNQTSSIRPGFYLRAFVPNARSSLHFEPTQSGGLVRLTAMGLPPPETLMPDGRTFVVWAVAPGRPPLVAGELKVDASGNGGLEFERPPEFERYSILVTTEPSPSVSNPTGVMVLATQAGAVSAFYGQRQQLSSSAQRRLRREMSRGLRSNRKATDFFTEVDATLGASLGGGREIQLVGDEVAPEAYGVARVAAQNMKAYIRAQIERLPSPHTIGAKIYVLWAIMSEGRIVYMGSLPTENLDRSDIYVRVAGFSTDNFDLFVTAEKRAVARPSGLRALSSRPPAENPDIR